MRLKLKKNIIMMSKRGHLCKNKINVAKRSESVYIIKSEQTQTGRVDSAVTHDIHHWTG